MKVKLRTQYAGPKGSHAPGSVVELDQAEAYALIEGGYAEQVEEAPPAPPLLPAAETPETATHEPAETAEAGHRRPKRRVKP